MLNVCFTSNSLLLLAPIAIRGHGMHFALVRAQVESVSVTFYCSPDDRAALYIQVYTQTEEILTGEVV